MTDTDHPRVTTASIDRRVERLESAQQETDRKVDAMGLQLTYIREVMDLKFSSMEAAMSAQGAKLDAFMARIDALIAESLRNAGDLRSQPLGRQIDDRLAALESLTEDHDKIIDETRGFGVGFRQFIFPSIALVISVLSILLAMGHLGG